MSEHSTIELVFGCVTALASALGAWGAVKATMATVMAELQALKSWVEDMDGGGRKLDGTVQATLDSHGNQLRDHYDRIRDLETAGPKGCRLLEHSLGERAFGKREESSG